MRVIVTGGSGLIGRELTNHLILSGHEVVIVSRSPERLKNLPAEATIVKWDAQTAAGWGTQVDGAEVIINLAGANIGATRWTDERKQLILQSRLQTSRAIVEAIRMAKAKPRLLIQASAVGYYGNRGDEQLTEASAAGNDFLAHVCIEWEKAVAPAQEVINVAYIRTGVVLTTKGGALPKMLLPFKLFAGGAFGSGRQWFPWIHIDDEIAAILFLLNQDETQGIYNLNAPQVVTNRDFAQALGRVLKRPAAMPTPAFALKLALGEMSALLLDGQRVVPQRLQEMGFAFQYPEVQPALQDILEHHK